MSKINSIEDINLNLEEGRLAYAAMSLLRDFLIHETGEENAEKVTPSVVLEGVKKRVVDLFPDLNNLVGILNDKYSESINHSGILSETGEPIRRESNVGDISKPFEVK